MIGTTLRHSKVLITRRPVVSQSKLSPLSNAFFQISSSAAPSSNPPNANVLAPQQRNFSLKPTNPTPELTKPLYNNLSSTVIDQIKADLKAVDFDNNGKIDADELRVLLKRHNSTFTDDEIVELSELFYASRAGGAVPMDEFVAALDSAANRDGEKGLIGKKMKTHPLGIGTCASEYM